MKSSFESHRKTFNHIFVGTWTFVILMWICWGFNLKFLLNCDFEPDYREEIVHSIGLFPPASIVTVWYDKE